MMQDLIGTIIANHYRLDRVIGEGGMSVVFRAVDLYTGIEVAVKILKQGKTSHRVEDVFRFRREATLVSDLDHPNLLKVYEVGEEGGLYYIAMELVEGTGLDEFMRHSKPMTVSGALSITAELASTLAYVHSAGIVHRDVKPGNIMILSETPRGSHSTQENANAHRRLKILDFGLSQVMEMGQIKQKEEIVGTFSYMSPEQTGLIRKPVDERSDLYSLGIVFYELLTAELPFKGKDVGTILHRQVAQNPLPPARINREIPPTVEKIALKLINKDPNDRYQTARGLLHDLRRCQAGESVFVLGKEDRAQKLTYRTKLVGRAKEQRILKDLLAAAEKGRGHVCLVSGGAGQGKSRLVSEMRDPVVQKGGDFIFGRCFRQENKVPYHPFAEALNSYLDQLQHLSAKEKRRRIRRMKENLGEQAEIICRLNPEIRRILGDFPSIVRLDPEKENQRFIMVCAKFFHELGVRGKPTVMVLDDLQWCDEGSLSLLEEILEEIAYRPLLILATYRETEIGPHHRLRRMIRRVREKRLPLEVVSVEPFGEPSVQELLAELLGEAYDSMEDLARYIHRRSKGNVLYALEIVRQLVEEKVLEPAQGAWAFHHNKLEKVKVPQTMLEAMQNRIKWLEPDQAHLLSVASVMGCTFQMDVLYALSDHPQEKIIHWIDSAFDLQLLERGTAPGEVEFVHDRIQEVFYGRLQRAQRQQLHAKIAWVLEELYGHKSPDILFDLAHHYCEAKDHDRCLRYALPAADEARKSYANEEAMRYYTMALRRLEDRGQQKSADWIRAKEGLLGVYSTIGQIEAAVDIARELLEVKTSPVEKARLYRSIGLNCIRKADYQRAEENLALGLALLGKKLPKAMWQVFLGIGKEILVHGVHTLLPFLYSHQRNKSVSPENKEIALLYEASTLLYVLGYYVKFFYATLKLMNFSESKLGKSRELAGALMGYAMACAGVTRFSRAIKYHHIALNMKEEVGDENGVAQSLRYLGFTYIMMGDYDKAERNFQAARRKFLAMGDLFELTHALNGLNLIYHHKTDLDKRDDVVNTMLALSQKIKNYWGTSIALESFGGTYLIRGDFEEAENWLKKADAFSQEHGIWLALCLCHAIYSQLALEKNDARRAVHHADLAQQIERDHNLIKPIVALSYVYRVDAHMALFKERRPSLSLTEQKQELKKLTPLVKDMRAQTLRWPVLRGMALRSYASFRALQGKTAKAEQLFSASIGHLKALDRSFELAKSCYDYGRYLEERGMEEEAKKQWFRALNIFRRLGAKAYEKRTTSLLGMEVETPHLWRDWMDKSRLTSLLQVSRDISSILNIDQLLRSIMAKAVEVTGAQRGYLFLLNEKTGEMDLRIRHNMDKDDEATRQFSKNIVHKVFETGENIIATNAAQSSELSAYMSVVSYNLKSILCVPILYHQRGLGVCYLDNPLSSGVFSPEDGEMLRAFMAQSAICIENATAYEKIRILNRELEKEGERIKEENRRLKKLARPSVTHIRAVGPIHIVTQDPKVMDLIDEADRLARSTANVLISGESGVGKEIFAHLIHLGTGKKDRPFVKVNCAAIPDTLFESEFFGYEKGAFTGALKTKKGKFELAHGGTLFLDEVGDFPMAQQAKLLRTLEEGEITRVGGHFPIKVDVKVICATNKDLAKRVKEGTFREDLYFRLNVLPMHIPPLRERIDDIPTLASYFLSQVANIEGGREKYFDDAALLYLKALDLPGNVRELKNLVHRVYLSTEEDVVTKEDIHDCLSADAGDISPRSTPLGRSAETRPFVETDERLFEESIPFRKFKNMFERRYLTSQLRKHDFNVSQTAKSLELQPSALFRKLKSLHIKVNKSVH
jgi:transcriptional regulator with GAF, ATPase, and Fis domain/tRNA A-37 threonylcarbamoyl transferase component Bud32